MKTILGAKSAARIYVCLRHRGNNRDGPTARRNSPGLGQEFEWGTRQRTVRRFARPSIRAEPDRRRRDLQRRRGRCLWLQSGDQSRRFGLGLGQQWPGPAGRSRRQLHEGASACAWTWQRQRCHCDLDRGRTHPGAQIRWFGFGVGAHGTVSWATAASWEFLPQMAYRHP